MDAYSFKGSPEALVEELNSQIAGGNEIVQIQRANSMGSYLIVTAATGPVINDYLLMETGDQLLLETNDKIILE